MNSSEKVNNSGEASGSLVLFRDADVSTEDISWLQNSLITHARLKINRVERIFENAGSLAFKQMIIAPWEVQSIQASYEPQMRGEVFATIVSALEELRESGSFAVSQKVPTAPVRVIHLGADYRDALMIGYGNELAAEERELAITAIFNSLGTQRKENLIGQQEMLHAGVIMAMSYEPSSCRTLYKIEEEPILITGSKTGIGGEIQLLHAQMMSSPMPARG